jgi:spermidine/putrescine transport system substrate-binding protein
MKMRFLWLALLLFGCSSPKQELHIYCWGNYLEQDVIEIFEKQYNCRVVVNTYDSNESMYAKLKAGAAGYDLVCPSNYLMDLMIDQGMLQKLDKTQIPNLKYFDETYAFSNNQRAFDYGAPFLISFGGVSYRKDRIKNPVPSWNIFSEKKWRNRMTMLNDLREVIGAALKYLGFSANTVVQSEIDAATDLVITWKKNLAKFESEQFKNGIASAEFLVVQGYNGDILQVMQENDHVDFYYPMEGALVSCDYLALAKEAPEVELAHAFINFLYEPSISAKNITHSLFLSPNKGAYPLLSNELQANPVLFPPPSVLQKAELIENLGLDIIKYNQAWDRIKSAE